MCLGPLWGQNFMDVIPNGPNTNKSTSRLPRVLSPKATPTEHSHTRILIMRHRRGDAILFRCSDARRATSMYMVYTSSTLLVSGNNPILVRAEELAKLPQPIGNQNHLNVQTRILLCIRRRYKTTRRLRFSQTVARVRQAYEYVSCFRFAAL